MLKQRGERKGGGGEGHVKWVLILPASLCFCTTASMPVMVKAPSAVTASAGEAPGLGGPSSSCRQSRDAG